MHPHVRDDEQTQDQPQDAAGSGAPASAPLVRIGGRWLHRDEIAHSSSLEGAAPVDGQDLPQPGD
jgi:hypothetical protein